MTWDDDSGRQRECEGRLSPRIALPYYKTIEAKVAVDHYDLSASAFGESPSLCSLVVVRDEVVIADGGDGEEGCSDGVMSVAER